MEDGNSCPNKLHQRQPHQLVLSEDDGIGRNVPGNNAVGTDDTIITNYYTFQNGNIAVNFHIFTDNDWRSIEFGFVPDIFRLGVESMVVIVEFTAFSNAGIIA